MTTTRRLLCPCRIGATLGVLAVVSAFVVRATNHTLDLVALGSFLLCAPAAMIFGLTGCRRTEPDHDEDGFLTERTVAHTGVAMSVLSLVVFLV